MNTSKNKITLDDVLNDYMVSELSPNHATLEEWIQKYPEYEKELTEFTINWTLMENAPPPEDTNEVTNDTLVLRAMSIVEDQLYKNKLKNTKKKDEIQDLSLEFKKKKLTIINIAAMTGMGRLIIPKLAKRLIEYQTIPIEAIRRLAEAIDQNIDVLSEYFQKPIYTSPNTKFKSKTVPKKPTEKQDFFDAIRTDTTITDDNKTFWLSLRKDSK